MATAPGQDIICCQLCPNPVKHHCNLCNVDLCLSCMTNHMADDSRKHEVVGYSSKKKHSFVLPICPSHMNNRCETYCRDCDIPICIQCKTGLHTIHKLSDINDILQEKKKHIIANTEELESTIGPKYRKKDWSTKEFDKVLTTIQKHEDKICKAVRETSTQLKNEVTKQKTEAIRTYNERQPLAEKEINQIVQKNKDTVKGNDATALLNYKLSNWDLRKGLELPSCPRLRPGIFNQDQIVEIFGFLQTEDNLEKKPGMLKMLNDPVVQHTIPSPYGYHDKRSKRYGCGHELWRVLCVGKNKILTSGDNKTIKQVDKTGSILNTIHTKIDVRALAIKFQQEPDEPVEPVFASAMTHDKDIHISIKNEDKVYFSTPGWYSVGLHYTANGELLVSMRSMDRKQSRVMRYTGTTEIQKIQYDSQGQPLLSTGVTDELLLTENGNGDICVADKAGEIVVVVDSSGGLRFKYTGNLSKQSKYREFTPYHIATDVNTQILISDTSNDIVHIIDCDGNFIRYIQHPCKGGLSVDEDHNLVIGDKNSGIIKVIKYIE